MPQPFPLHLLYNEEITNVVLQIPLRHSACEARCVFCSGNFRGGKIYSAKVYGCTPRHLPRSLLYKT